MTILGQIIYKVYVLLLMAFTVWYGVFMYSLIFGFEGKEEAAASLLELTGGVEMEDLTEEEKMFTKLLSEQGARSETNLGFKVIEQPFIEGRFHHVGFQIQKDSASMCVKCHGNVAHNESKELRSFLNMHAFYLACETCHATPEEGDPPWQFRWYDKDTGEIVPNPTALADIEAIYASEDSIESYPTYGNYGAKIVPGAEESGGFKLLHGPKEMLFVEKFVAEQERLQPEQKSQMKTVIHRKVANDPVGCDGCHTQEDQYFSFAELGYPPTRERELTNTAVVGMIRKYKEFYIPSFLAPGGRRE
jgi:hypothetical protein